MRIHVFSNDENVLSPFRVKIYDVLDKILDVAHFVRNAIDDLTEQIDSLAVFLTHIGNVNYRRNHLRNIA